MDLVRKTGDRLVVTDPEGEDVFVLMGVDQYEDLLGMKDACTLCHDDVDKGADEYEDSGEYSEPEELPPPAIATPPKDIWEAMPPAGAPAETWNVEDLGKEEQEQMAKQYEAYLQGNPVLPEVQASPVALAPEIPIPEQAPKPESPPSSADLYNEDQFYLEPIE